MEMVIQGEKVQLRKKLLEKLLSLTKEEVKRRSEDVEQILSILPIYKQAKLIMAYFPLKGEVNLLRMIGKDLGKKRFCFPVMDLDKRALRAFEVKDLETDFVTGPYGVKQPDPLRAREVDVKDIDLVIVPGLAFDREHNRLGRGAGFYDRFLAGIKPPTHKLGVAFNIQILGNLPIHPPFDEKVDIVVSEDSSF